MTSFGSRRDVSASDLLAKNMCFRNTSGSEVLQHFWWQLSYNVGLGKDCMKINPGGKHSHKCIKFN